MGAEFLPLFQRNKKMTPTHVIALHCSGSSAKQWRSLSQRLAGRYPAWCPDLVGSGGNGHWHGERPFGLADEAAAVVSAIDTLPGAVHLIGHSYGGAVALRVARERPDRIASLSLYEPVALHVLRSAGPAGHEAFDRIKALAADIDRAVLTGDRRAAARRFVEYWSPPGTWAALSEQAQAEVIRYMPKASLEFRAVAAERTPLVAYRRGEYADEPSQIIARQLGRAMRFASLRTVFGAGHMGPLTHADLIADLMADFIGQQERDDASAASGEIPLRRAA
jgi:pimeloyl-ACP methyl ester carboxylesterase